MRWLRGAVLMLGLLALSSWRAQAIPIIRLKSQAQWQSALAAGYLQGYDPTSGTARNLSNKTVLSKTLPGEASKERPTALALRFSSPGGLITATGSAADLNKQIIGAWSYHGPDPDWSQSLLSLQVGLPRIGVGDGLDLLQIAVVDTSQRVKAWQWNAGALTPGFPTFQFFLNGGLGAGGSTGFFEDAGFDLTHSAYLQFAYRGTLLTTYPIVPVTNPATSRRALWTNPIGLTVVPEPGGLAILGTGVLMLSGMGLLRSRRRRNPAHESK